MLLIRQILSCADDAEQTLVPHSEHSWLLLRASIAAISEDQRILKVILRFFGRKHAVEVFLMDVEKIS